MKPDPYTYEIDISETTERTVTITSPAPLSYEQLIQLAYEEQHPTIPIDIRWGKVHTEHSIKLNGQDWEG